jgi:hypothetical protein
MSVTEAHQLLQEQPQQYVLVDVRNAEEQQVCSCLAVHWTCAGGGGTHQLLKTGLVMCAGGCQGCKRTAAGARQNRVATTSSGNSNSTSHCRRGCE